MCCLPIYGFTPTKVLLLCQCDYMEETLRTVCWHLDNMHLCPKFSESLLEFDLGLFSRSEFSSLDVNLNVIMTNHFVDLRLLLHSTWDASPSSGGKSLSTDGHCCRHSSQSHLCNADTQLQLWPRPRTTILPVFQAATDLDQVQSESDCFS